MREEEKEYDFMNVNDATFTADDREFSLFREEKRVFIKNFEHDKLTQSHCLVGLYEPILLVHNNRGELLLCTRVEENEVAMIKDQELLQRATLALIRLGAVLQTKHGGRWFKFDRDETGEPNGQRNV